MMSNKNAAQSGAASEAWIYDWSTSSQAACINSSTICFSVAGLWRCLTRIASSRADSGERLMFRWRRPTLGRLPPQFGLSVARLGTDLSFQPWKLAFLKQSNLAVIVQVSKRDQLLLIMEQHMPRALMPLDFRLTCLDLLNDDLGGLTLQSRGCVPANAHLSVPSILQIGSIGRGDVVRLLNNYIGIAVANSDLITNFVSNVTHKFSLFSRLRLLRLRKRLRETVLVGGFDIGQHIEDAHVDSCRLTQLIDFLLRLWLGCKTVNFPPVGQIPHFKRPVFVRRIFADFKLICHCLVSLSQFYRTNLVHLNYSIYQDESQCFSSEFQGNLAHPEKLVG